MSTAEERCGRRAGAVRVKAAPYTEEPELAISALLHLMSRFPARRSPTLAQAVVDHLRLVGNDPQIAPCVREAAQALTSEWEAYALLSAASDLAGAGRMC